jgi:hypothetical protein
MRRRQQPPQREREREREKEREREIANGAVELKCYFCMAMYTGIYKVNASTYYIYILSNDTTTT